MENSYVPSPTNKKEYISDIGKILVEENGKKKYYKPEEVIKAHRRSKWNTVADFSCWAISTFSSHSDFDNYFGLIGLAYDYAEMKSEMLNGLSVSPTVDLAGIPEIDIDASLLEFGDDGGGMLEGFVDFIGSIFG